MTIPQFQKTILTWYKKNKRDLPAGRQDLPWRKTRDPYNILISEIMLQQTQVSRVIPKYKEFLKTFPTVEALANAKDQELLKVWSGLGYWRRARFLKETARQVVEQFGGQFPTDTKTLRTLPGIGPYTAGAVACFAFNSTEAFIDTNIRRVYLHFFFPDKQNVSDKEILAIAEQAVDKKDPRQWGYALFDYGATQLKNKKINQRSRHYTKQSQFQGSFRSFRTKVVKQLLAAPSQTLSQAVILDFLEDELRVAEKDYSPHEIIQALIKDKLIKQQKDFYTL